MSKKLKSHLTKRKLDAMFRPYAFELGKLTFAWNRLHETLASLFWKVTGLENGSIPLAIWHSIRSDLTQRQILRAAAEDRFAHQKTKREDIVWLLDKIDRSLAGQRNDALHAPMMFLADDVSTQLLPDSFSRNPRAKGLVGKDLLAEIIWYHQKAEALRLYAASLDRAVFRPERYAWPERPQLPTLGEQKISKRTRQATTGKGHRLRLRLPSQKSG